MVQHQSCSTGEYNFKVKRVLTACNVITLLIKCKTISLLINDDDFVVRIYLILDLAFNFLQYELPKLKLKSVMISSTWSPNG